MFLRKGKYTNVYVVTSDGDEQIKFLVRGTEDTRRELYNDIRLAKAEERNQYTHNHHRDHMRIRRNELGDLLDPTVAEKLEAIRRNK